MNHKWDRKLNKTQKWCQCVRCGIIKETDYSFGQIYFKDGNDGGQSDKIWFGKVPLCKIIKEINN